MEDVHHKVCQAYVSHVEATGSCAQIPLIYPFGWAMKVVRTLFRVRSCRQLSGHSTCPIYGLLQTWQPDDQSFMLNGEALLRKVGVLLLAVELQLSCS